MRLTTSPFKALRRTWVVVPLLSITMLAGGCSSPPEQRRTTDQEPAATETETSSSTSTTAAAVSTRRLDSIAVLGHSGATGTMSDPEDPLRDAHENSWATGDNPRVDSIYRRLLEDHPELEGHNYNHARNGTAVDDLKFQFENLLTEADPLPDVILIQTIDNDMRCDGSDPDNYRPYGRTLDQTLALMEKTIPNVQFLIVGPWATVEAWTAWASRHEEHVLVNSGTGPCDVFDAKGNPRPAGMRSLQEIVDSYWAQVEKVCAAHRGCFTDGRAVETEFVPNDRDLSADLNHLSIAGHAKYASIVWRAFPSEIKQRP